LKEKLVEYILSFFSKLGINGYLVIYFMGCLFTLYNIKNLKNWTEKEYWEKILIINTYIGTGLMTIFLLLELFGFIHGFILSD